jgi:hypothetical protein
MPRAEWSVCVTGRPWRTGWRVAATWTYLTEPFSREDAAGKMARALGCSYAGEQGASRERASGQA